MKVTQYRTTFSILSAALRRSRDPVAVERALSRHGIYFVSEEILRQWFHHENEERGGCDHQLPYLTECEGKAGGFLYGATYFNPLDDDHPLAPKKVAP